MKTIEASIFLKRLISKNFRNQCKLRAQMDFAMLANKEVKNG